VPIERAATGAADAELRNACRVEEILRFFHELLGLRISSTHLIVSALRSDIILIITFFVGPDEMIRVVSLNAISMEQPTCLEVLLYFRMWPTRDLGIDPRYDGSSACITS
jgi:hypothetical protein